MRKIYLDSEFKCHLANDGSMMIAETDLFDDKCDAYIEGYRYIPSDKSWVREDGIVIHGESMFPWVDSRILSARQEEYEVHQATIAELDTAILDMTYQNIIESIE